MSGKTKSLKWSLAQQLEIRWWKRYLSGKEPEAYLQWKTDYWQKLLLSLKNLPELKDNVVLDAGCGPAGIFIALPNSTVTALDPLLESYKTLEHFQPQRYPNVRFVSSPLEHLEEKAVYDTIFCLNAINHVADIQLAYDKLVEALKPGGTLVVSIDAHNHQWLKKIFKALPGDVLHPHQYDEKEYAAFLTDRNCKVVETICKDEGYIFNYYIQVAVKT